MKDTFTQIYKYIFECGISYAETSKVANAQNR